MNLQPTGKASFRRIDGHVHLIGDGSSGSGSWFRLETLWQRLLAKTMVREMRLPSAVIVGGDFDRIYREALLNQVRESSLDAVLILAQEVPRDGYGVEMDGVGAFFVPNDYVLELGRRHPEFVPAVSIHPSRPDALDELERCLEAGARVMKCLPNCQNINCNDPKYTGFWSRMAEAGMLLLAHTGGEMSLPVVRPEYADPRSLRLPLELGVTVIAAHCAGRSCLYDPDYTDVLIEMFGRYPNLYGDNSALCSPIRSRTIKKIFQADVADRIIHGSDFPIPVSGLGPVMRGRVNWRDYLVSRRENNVLERDYRLKKAMGFQEGSFALLDELIFRSADNERKK